MRFLSGSYDHSTGELAITGPNGQTYRNKERAMTAESHKVLGVGSVGDEMHVQTNFPILCGDRAEAYAKVG